MTGFFDSVYELVAQIPKGKVTTYGQIALLLGRPGGARTVGWAMKAAPEHLSLPCHRVVNRLGEMAPGATFGSPEAQRDMLAAEGVAFLNTGCIDMKKHMWPGPERR